MSDWSWEKGYLRRLPPLTTDQLEEAMEAAFANATDLLVEADILAERHRYARAYFLAHVASEELGKLPLLASTAVTATLGREMDWRGQDSKLRSHAEKVEQALFTDSLFTSGGLEAGAAALQDDVLRMRTYLDTKNACLYSAFIEHGFTRPQAVIPSELFESFRRLGEGRLRAMEAMYMTPLRRAGGLHALLQLISEDKLAAFVQVMMGDDARAAYDAYQASGDESQLRRFLMGQVRAILGPELG